MRHGCIFLFFFFNDTATTEIYTLSLHDALPISSSPCSCRRPTRSRLLRSAAAWKRFLRRRSEEHTSELQSQSNLVCRLLLEKKKTLPHTLLHSALIVSRVPRRTALELTIRPDIE